MQSTVVRFKLLAFLAAVAILTLPPAAQAALVTYNLRADKVDLTMADGTIVKAWGFADDSGGPGSGTVTVPGPILRAAPNDQLIVNLTNNLPVPVSIVIPGQVLTVPTPVKDATVPAGIAQAAVASIPAVPDATRFNRVYSFTVQAAANGGVQQFQVASLKAGTYLYESGSHPAMQVPMGLYGALVVGPGASGQAYTPTATNPGTAYDRDAVLLFSEIDPAFNAFVDANNSTVKVEGGKAVKNYSIDYKARYFLINGKSFPDTADIQNVLPGTKTLLRILNASGRNFVPALTGNFLNPIVAGNPKGAPLNTIAEDGNLLPYPRQEQAVVLNAGKTYDALVMPAAEGYFALYDRRLGLLNGQRFDGTNRWTQGAVLFLQGWDSALKNCLPTKGDLNGDDKVTLADVLIMLRATVGLVTLTPQQKINGDVFPLDAASKLPCGSGGLAPAPDPDMADLLLLLKKAVGLASY